MNTGDRTLDLALAPAPAPVLPPAPAPMPAHDQASEYAAGVPTQVSSITQADQSLMSLSWFRLK